MSSMASVAAGAAGAGSAAGAGIAIATGAGAGVGVITVAGAAGPATGAVAHEAPGITAAAATNKWKRTDRCKGVHFW